MKKRHFELLDYLSTQNGPVTSNELSNALNVSIRSVKQYIYEINHTYETKLIFPSHNGYELNPHAKSIIHLNTEEIPQTAEERIFYIIKELMLNHTSNLELFELCDFLCISYSTVKSLISKMNKMFSSYEVEFICKNDKVYIHGDEQHKRKLISYVINEEAKNSYVNMDILKDTFSDIDVDALSRIIMKTFKKYNYYLNDFAATNLLLHILIIIDRESNGNELDSGESNISIDSNSEKMFFSELRQNIENEFHIHFNKFELSEIFMLFKANANLCLDIENSDLKKVVDDSYIQLINEYIVKIRNLYMIDLSSNSFTVPFSLHLKNLILRAQLGQYTQNPMTSAIKFNSPIVFDIAIYIALDLMDRFNIDIAEDEIAFLAMHIGAEVERQTLDKNKISAILICPNYHDIANNILNTLMLNFGNQLNLINTVSNESDLQKIFNEKKIGMIFTTIPLQQNYENTSIVTLSPFNLLSQFQNIQMAISDCYEAYKEQKLRINFHNFFDKDLFTVNPSFKTKQQIIAYLCDKLRIKEYVDDSFEENVNRRENAATTAFNHIAIPHTVEMEAIKTSIAVAISKKGIQWDTHTVHVVLLLAINKADQRNFRYLYESIISMFSDEKIIQEIRNCNTFNDFEKLIYSKMTTKE